MTKKPSTHQASSPPTPTRKADTKSDSTTTTTISDLPQQLKELRLPMIREMHTQVADQAARDQWSHLQYLAELTAKECESRSQNRVARLMKSSHLLEGKTWEQFQWSRLPLHVTQQLEILRSGSFLDRQDNVLIFGNPGSGKTMLLSALGDQLIRRGRSVLFTTCQMLVQELLRAKRDLRMERWIKKLSKFEALIIDDLGYVQQSREEMEVLFTLLSERYERGSVLLSSNLPFSKWEQIFKDPMTTAAAVDRLVHHSVIIELKIKSYRLDEAKAKSAQPSPGSKDTKHVT